MSDPFSRFRQKLEFLKNTEKKSPLLNKKNEKKFTLPDEWEKIGDYTYMRIVPEENRERFALGHFITFQSQRIPITDLIFFDLETTGLSGGAGTIAFLAGIAYFDHAKLFVEQYFLTDYPGEAEFLQFVNRRFTNNKCYVSYNGKGFDTHLLKSRFVMAGMELSIGNQLDLLYISRRFFKRTIGSCTLSDIEQKVLGIARTGDIPGYLIPDTYFDYLHKGDASEIVKVFYHNEQDIVSLVKLFELIIRLTTIDPVQGIPEYAKNPVIDRAALGLSLLSGQPEAGIAFLEYAINENDFNAGRFLSLYYKKNQLWDKALKIWLLLWKSRKSVFAAIEISKYYEHKEKNLKEALAWVESVFRLSIPLERIIKDDLLKRKNRITLKLSNR